MPFASLFYFGQWGVISSSVQLSPVAVGSRPLNTMRRRPSYDRTDVLVSMNIRGLDNEDVKLAEVVGMLTSGESTAPLAFALQETWHTETSPCGWSMVTRTGCTVIKTGEAWRPQRGRQRNGVALVLGPAASKAWRALPADKRKPIFSGPRHLAIELTLGGRTWRLGSAYAPDSSKPDLEYLEFLAQLGGYAKGGDPRKLLLVGMDGNASVGRSSRRQVNAQLPLGGAGRQPIGGCGFKRLNKRGEMLLNFLADGDLCLANTFFQRSGPRNVGTFRQTNGSLHQIDYWLTNHFTRVSFVTDCGKENRWVPQRSDHEPVRITLRVRRPRHHSAGQRVPVLAAPRRLDGAALRGRNSACDNQHNQQNT